MVAQNARVGDCFHRLTVDSLPLGTLTAASAISPDNETLNGPAFSPIDRRTIFPGSDFTGAATERPAGDCFFEIFLAVIKKPFLRRRLPISALDYFLPKAAMICFSGLVLKTSFGVSQPFRAAAIPY